MPKIYEIPIVGKAFENVVATLFSFAIDPDGFKEHRKNMTDEQREFAKLQFESSLEVINEVHKNDS